MPWNVNPVYGGDAPVSGGATWHGKNYSVSYKPSDEVAAWDGCSDLPDSVPIPNVDGIGQVASAPAIRNPIRELQELVCRNTPGTYLYAVDGGLSMQGCSSSLVYIYLEGKRTNITSMRTVGTVTRDSLVFASDESGVIYEYRVWDRYNYKELRPWTPVVSKTDIAWLSWRVNGPGEGDFTLYVRSIDPAGNRDVRFYLGKNQYEWYYVSPIPWDIIGGTLGEHNMIAFFFLLSLSYFEYRRRRKKAAME
eukprot:gene9208-19100_t